MSLPTEPTVPPLPPAAPKQHPPDRRLFRLGLGVGISATVAVVSLTIGVVAGIRALSTPDTFDITGMIALKGKTTSSGLPTGFACAGASGYSDLSPAAAVKVSDESGTLLAKGNLTGSSGSSGYCIFDFAVTDVPRGIKFYEVEVSRRGGLTYTEAEAEAGLSLTLGD